MVDAVGQCGPPTQAVNDHLGGRRSDPYFLPLADPPGALGLSPSSPAGADGFQGRTEDVRAGEQLQAEEDDVRDQEELKGATNCLRVPRVQASVNSPGGRRSYKQFTMCNRKFDTALCRDGISYTLVSFCSAF